MSGKATFQSGGEIQYFLGANAPGGFYSLYSELLPIEEAHTIYILKGGAGCGKSTLMRQVARELAQVGEPAEYILCSGDPHSLDGVVFPRIKVALVDGTAPHVIEPRYPGVVEEYVNLGSCYRRKELQTVGTQIKECMAGYQAHYQRAYRCLDAAAEITEDMRAMLTTEQLEDQLAKRARSIVLREIPPKKTGETGHVVQRFLDGMTHLGMIRLYETALAQCSRIYELVDSYGLAHLLLSHILSGGVMGGYHVVACPDPMFPDQLAHIILPELELAVLSSTSAQPCCEKPYRRIRLDTMVDADLLRRCRPRLRFARKVSMALMEEAVDSLAQAKGIHDELEALYNPFVDFHMGKEIGHRITQEILSISPV